MPSLVNWIDFNKFNKELLDDDYNPGQKFVVKAKTTSADGTTVIEVFKGSIGIYRFS